MDDLTEHAASKNERYTLTYRAVEARQVMAWLKVGQSGCIIGLRGVGKSNFLRFLFREDVRRHYLGEDHADFAFILIDLLALTERTEWAIWELILDRLLAEIRPRGIASSIVEEIASAHREVMRTQNSLIALRAIEYCLSVLCAPPAGHVILFFDEFDAVLGILDRAVLLALRALRDAHKDQLSYLVVTIHDPGDWNGGVTESERFDQLLRQNVCDLRPCVEADAQQIIRYHAAQRSLNLSPDDITRLIELSGGHAGLLKVMLRLLWNAPQECTLTNLAPALNHEPLVEVECHKMWGTLSPHEQAAISALSGTAALAPSMLERLKRQGLVRTSADGSLVLFSSLFAEFIRRQFTPPARSIVVRRNPPEVQIEGRIIVLAPLEFEVLCYLYEHRGQVCTKDALIESVYRQQHAAMRGGVSDEALQTLISRLRKQIEPDRQQPRYILTIRGEGYRLVELL